MDLLRRRAMKYAQEQKYLKEFHFKALEVVVADQEVDEEKEKSNSNNSNPTTPNDDNVLEKWLQRVSIQPVRRTNR